MREIRYLDKLIDELAKGIAMAVLCTAAALAKSRKIQAGCLVGVFLILLSFIFEVSTLSPM